MSLYGALFSGVSGLAAQSSAMGAISDNITNVNTVGYKGSKVNFSTLVTKQVSLTNYSPGGVQSKPRAGIDVQGLLQASNSSTDVALSGQGFFVVNEAANPESGDLFAYTRAGSFKVDKEGYLQNVSGWYMQGWPLTSWDNASQAAQVTVGNSVFMKSYKDDDGNTVYVNDNIVSDEHLKPLNLQEIGGTAAQTRNIRMGATLPSGADVGFSDKTNVEIFDSLGNSANVQFTWTKTAQNTWDLECQPPEGTKNLQLYDDSGNVYASVGRVDLLAKPATGTMTLTVGGDTWTIGLLADPDATTQTDRYVNLNPASSADTGTFATNLASEVNKIYRMQYEGSAEAIDLTGNNAIVVNGTTYSYNAATVSDLVTQINADNHGIKAAVRAQTDADSATLVLYTDNAQSYTVEGLNDLAIGTWATPGTTITGTGRTYAERIAGTNSMVFRQYDTAVDVTMTGLTAVLDSTGAKALGQGYDPVTATADQIVLDRLDLPLTTNAINFTQKGAPDSINVSSMSIVWSNGSASMTGSDEIGLFLGDRNLDTGMTQKATGETMELNYISQNGAAFGNFAGVSIGEDGIVTALFDNGVTRPVFMIPVATFVNANGMESLTGNVWIETDFSGQPTLREAGDAGAGAVSAAALEASTVDIGTEFTTMIVTQRAYSASAKIITTADEMLDELVRIKR